MSRASAELRLGLRPQADLVLVSFSDPAADHAASAEVLKEMLKLTKTEARVALALAHGETMHDIAADFDVSLNTVRTHVASAFAKTQTSRQADLVRVVLPRSAVRVRLKPSPSQDRLRRVESVPGRLAAATSTAA